MNRYALVIFAFFPFVLSVSGETRTLTREKLPIIAFQGEGGGFSPSLMRCNFALDTLSKLTSFETSAGFFSFTGSCSDDPFDKDRPHGLYFASIMKSSVQTTLPKGSYSSAEFCLRSRSMARIVSLLSTPKIQFVLNKSNAGHCEDHKMELVRFDIFIE